MNMPISHSIFRKYIFALGIGIFFIFQICLGSSVQNADSFEYSMDDTFYIIPYHLLHKREITPVEPALLNTTTAESIQVLTETNSTSAPEVKDVNVTTSAPNTDPSNSLYDADSGTDDELNVEGFNTSNVPKFDHHRYYRSFSKSGMDEVVQYWVDLDSMPEEKVVAHDSLSSAHRRALTVSLTFDFPFYGHVLNNITIATGGFLFTGSFLHKWLAATQYIAPLMANFDTSVSPDAMVKYADNGTSLTVQWEKVVLQDNPTVGPFTFQVTIHNSGHIVFAYRDIPVVVTLIEDLEHPVKVGLSDAYIVDKTIFYVRKKTIYEYHKIDIKKGMEINNWTAIVFEPLQLCLSFNTCETCLLAQTSFKCEWCPRVNRCSDGLDRHRQDWLEGGCEDSAVSNHSVCSSLPLPPPPSPSPSSSLPGAGAGAGGVRAAASLNSEQDSKSGHNLLVGLLMTAGVVVLVAGWVTYAYLHPHTASGQILIKYRPSAWSWRRGEARYTAATMHSIHM